MNFFVKLNTISYPARRKSFVLAGKNNLSESLCSLIFSHTQISTSLFLECVALCGFCFSERHCRVKMFVSEPISQAVLSSTESIQSKFSSVWQTPDTNISVRFDSFCIVPFCIERKAFFTVLSCSVRDHVANEIIFQGHIPSAVFPGNNILTGRWCLSALRQAHLWHIYFSL